MENFVKILSFIQKQILKQNKMKTRIDKETHTHTENKPTTKTT